MAAPYPMTAVDLPEASSFAAEAAAGRGRPAGRTAPTTTGTSPSATSPCIPHAASAYGRRRKPGPCRPIHDVEPGAAGRLPDSAATPPAETSALDAEALTVPPAARSQRRHDGYYCDHQPSAGLAATSETRAVPVGIRQLSPPDRSASASVPFPTIDISVRLPGGGPKGPSARSRAFIAASASPGPPGTLRVWVTIGAASAETAIPFDFDHALWDAEEGVATTPRAFTRLIEEAAFARLCQRHGRIACGPAPRGVFIPPIGSWAFRRRVVASGAGCHYRVCWPASSALRAASTSSTSSSSSTSSPAPSSPSRARAGATLG